MKEPDPEGTALTGTPREGKTLEGKTRPEDDFPKEEGAERRPAAKVMAKNRRTDTERADGGGERKMRHEKEAF